MRKQTQKKRTRNLSSAGHPSDFKLVFGFNKYGYRNREDITVLPPGVLVAGSQNVVTNTSNRLAIVQGYTIDGQSSTVLAPILASYDWLMHNGINQHVRGYLDPTTSQGVLQYRYVDSASIVTWKDLMTDLFSSQVNFTEYWNTTELKSSLLFVDGSSNIYEWSGGVATLLSASNATGVIGTLRITPSSGGSGYLVNDVLSISSGTSGSATVTRIVDGALQTVTIQSAGTSYTIGDVITVAEVGTGGTLTVTNVNGGGGITGFTLTTQGQNYGVVTNISTTGGTGSGFRVNITAINNGSVNAINVTNPGSAYSVGNGTATTGGTGTGATIDILTTVQGSIIIEGTRSAAELGFFNASGSQTLLINGTEYIYTNTTGTAFTGINTNPSAEPVGSVIVQAPIVTANVAMTGLPATFANSLIASLGNQVYVGSLVNNSVYVSKTNNYKNYSYSTPRVVGEGALFTFDSTPVAFIPQEKSMYFSCGHDLWYETVFQLSADLAKESLTINKLKTSTNQGAQSQAMVQKTSNDVVFVDYNPVLTTLGRVSGVIATPQNTDLSYPIINDFNTYDFTDGSVLTFKQFIYVAVPQEGLIRIYNQTDKTNQYWEAPVTYPVSRFAVIDGELYGHSYNTPETYKLFTGYNFNGAPIPMVAAFSYQNDDIRSQLKGFNEVYVEGYVNQNTTFTLGVRKEIDGCAVDATFELLGRRLGC
jgi:hypothetical protein